MANAAKRLVVKIGSSTLVGADGRLDGAYMAQVADQVAAVRAAGWQVIIVSSAAIACGLEVLGMRERPTDMPSLQAAASVGQCALVEAWAQAFAPHEVTTSLVLLTRRDTADRGAYLHARDTLSRLLDMGVVPIVNENDTVSVEQIRFGDNDTLGALVACLVDAQMLVILSDVAGLYDANPLEQPDAQLIPRVSRIDGAILGVAGDAGSAVGSGGMATKVKAARVLMAAGHAMVVCNGHEPGAIERICAGESVGTLFEAKEVAHEITPRKLWIALGDAARGAIVVDDGARSALAKRGASLLCVGVRAVRGRFEEGDIVDIEDGTGYIVARGRVGAASDVLELACGLDSAALERNRLLATLADKPVVHRDDLIVFE